METKRIRILIAKPGLDGHDRGAKVICRALRDAGNEVIYTGLRRTPEEIVHAAVQEDVDVIGLSILSGAHTVLFPKIMRLLKDHGVADIKVIAGGIIPEKDIHALEKIGIEKVFVPGSSTKEIVDWVHKNCGPSPGNE
ncbi:MAG: cobalamin B12-binding domain-containing protein [Candidatus Aminicenantes bacterium]|jgi:methylmalonyl-CoA mutase C-terminal domain/subunit